MEEEILRKKTQKAPAKNLPCGTVFSFRFTMSNISSAAAVHITQQPQQALSNMTTDGAREQAAE